MLLGTDVAVASRLDEAAVVDFLTTTAGAMAAYGSLSPSACEQLRQALGSALAASGARPSSLLTTLDALDVPFIAVLTTHYGPLGLGLNLLRYSLRPAVAALQGQLVSLGQDLLRRSELLFNRPLGLMRGGHCVRYQLASTLLTTTAEAVATACGQLDLALAGLALMHPSDLDVAPGLDLAVARSLGFSQLSDLGLPLSGDVAWRLPLDQAMASLICWAGELLTQLIPSTDEDLGHILQATWEHLERKAAHLSRIELPQADSLAQWESSRLGLMAATAEVQAALARFAAALAGATHPAVLLAPSQAAAATPTAFRRRLAVDLMAKGASPGQARDAVEALLSYLQIKQLAPEAVLAAELTRLNPLLDAATLERLTALRREALLPAALDHADAGRGPTTSGATTAPQERSLTMLKMHRLGEQFQTTASRLASLTLALTALLIVTSCGLKTRPQSSVPDLRPDLPFRREAPTKAVDAAGPDKDTQGAVQPVSGGLPHDRRPTPPRPE